MLGCHTRRLDDSHQETEYYLKVAGENKATHLSALPGRRPGALTHLANSPTLSRALSAVLVAAGLDFVWAGMLWINERTNADPPLQFLPGAVLLAVVVAAGALRVGSGKRALMSAALVVIYAVILGVVFGALPQEQGLVEGIAHSRPFALAMIALVPIALVWFTIRLLGHLRRADPEGSGPSAFDRNTELS